jgi:hypothetical protein
VGIHPSPIGRTSSSIAASSNSGLDGDRLPPLPSRACARDPPAVGDGEDELLQRRCCWRQVAPLVRVVVPGVVASRSWSTTSPQAGRKLYRFLEITSNDIFLVALIDMFFRPLLASNSSWHFLRISLQSKIEQRGGLCSYHLNSLTVIIAAPSRW